jgi:hypothetical protein
MTKATYDELPDWLERPDTDFEAILDEAMAVTGAPVAATPAADEWNEALAEPKAIDLRDLPEEQTDLAEAEIPSWLEALKPRELSGEPPAEESLVEADAPVVTAGPLSGLRGALAIEPVPAEAHAAKKVTSWTISKSQHQQANLLRQLAREERASPTTAAPRRAELPGPVARLLLSLLLIGVVAAGLLLPDLGASLLLEELPLPAPAAAAYDTLAAVAPQGALVVFDYTPALAGELDPLADLVLAQLELNGSQVLAISQQSEGIGVAQHLLGDAPVYYVPGEALGLRRLASCLGDDGPASELSCQGAAGRPLLANNGLGLQDIGLIVVVTGDRDSLVNWVSQVGVLTDKPLVVAVTQALAPVAAPYLASGDLAGSLDGLPAGAAFGQRYAIGDDGGRRLLTAQAGALALMIAVFLVANLVGGVVALRARAQRRAA